MTKIEEILAQVYCLPQHSHKTLDAELLKDIKTAILSEFKRMLPEKKPDLSPYSPSDNQKIGYNTYRSEVLKLLEEV